MINFEQLSKMKKQLNIELLSQSSIMFGIACELFILPKPGNDELAECREFRIGLLFLQIRFRVF
jgi:hypothetical protein